MLFSLRSYALVRLRAAASALIALASGLLYSASSEAALHAPETLRIAYLDSFSPDFYVEVYAPTVQHLKKALPQYRFESVELQPPVSEGELAAQKPDFVFSSSGAYSIFAKPLALDLLTVRSSSTGDASPAAGCAFVVRADSPIKTIADMAGRRAVAASPQAFSGWLTGLDRIAREGHDPAKFFSESLFTDYGYPDVLSRVLVGDADVGLVNLCELERAEARRSVVPGSLRVVGNIARQNESCARSTELFPGAAIAALPTAPNAAVKDVTMALLSMPSRDHWEWTSASHVAGIDQFLEHLHLGPYAYLDDWSPAALMKRYATEILLCLALITAALYHIIRTDKLVAQRTQELRETLAQRDRIAEKARKTQAMLSLFERRSIVSELSTMFAHEMKQPAANLVNYAAGLTMLARRRPAGETSERELAALAAVSREARRMADIVERVRAYAKHEPQKREAVNLSSVIAETVENFRLSHGAGAAIETAVPVDLTLQGDRVSLELLFLNLIRNADRALAKVEHPLIRVTGEQRDHEVRITVEDNGPGVGDEQLAQLGRAAGASHPEGLGLGLTIAAGIAEVHNGHLEFTRSKAGGLAATARFHAEKEPS